MAFAFSSINDLLGDEGEDSQARSNIFGGGLQQQSGAAQQGGAGGAVSKTIDESGAMGTGGAANAGASGSGGTGGGAAQASAQDQRLGERRAYESSAGKTARPSALSGISSQLDQRQKELQSASDSYLASERAKQNYAIDQETLKKSYAGDEEAFGKVIGLLNKGAADPVSAAFVPPDIKVADIELLQNDAGLAKLMSQGQDAGYTGGMGAFDVMAAKKNAGFQDEIKAIRARNDELQRSADASGTDVTTRANQYAANKLAEAKKAAKIGLTSAGYDIKRANIAEARDWNKQKNEADLAEATRLASKEAAKNVTGVLGQANPNAVQFIDRDAVDYSQFVNRGADLNYDSFISKDEAGQYNTILQLLGEGGDTWKESGAVQDPRQAFTINQQGIEEALRSGALGRFDVFRGKTDAEIKQIIKQAGLTADDLDRMYNEQLAKGPDLEALRKEAEQLYVDQKYGDLYKDYYKPDLLNVGDYTFKDIAKQDLDWKDVLSQTDAEKLQGLAKGIGEVGDYKAGDFAGKTSSSVDFFDDQRYLADLQAKLKELRDRGLAPRPETAPYNTDPNFVDDRPPSPAESAAQAGKDLIGNTVKSLKNPSGIPGPKQVIEQGIQAIRDPLEYIGDQTQKTKNVVGKYTDIAKDFAGGITAATKSGAGELTRVGKELLKPGVDVTIGDAASKLTADTEKTISKAAKHAEKTKVAPVKIGVPKTSSELSAKDLKAEAKKAEEKAAAKAAEVKAAAKKAEEKAAKKAKEKKEAAKKALKKLVAAPAAAKLPSLPSVPKLPSFNPWGGGGGSSNYDQAAADAALQYALAAQQNYDPYAGGGY